MLEFFIFFALKKKEICPIVCWIVSQFLVIAQSSSSIHGIRDVTSRLQMGDI